MSLGLRIATPLTCCLLLGAEARAEWDWISQQRSAVATASVYAATRCDGGETNHAIAPDFAPFEASVGAIGPSCSQYLASASASQTSVLEAGSLTAMGSSSAVCDNFGYAVSSSTLRLGFHIDTPRSFVLEGRIQSLSAGSNGSASAHLILIHPDGSVDSVRVSSRATSSGARAERTLQTHGGLLTGDYIVEAKATATGAVFVSSSSFSLHVESRGPVGVEALSWQRLKALYR